MLLAAPSLSVGFGVLPEASLGLGGGVGIETDRWRLLLSGVWYFDVRVHLADASDQGAQVGRRVARLGSCHWFGSGAFRFGPCATVALAYLVTRGVGSGVAAEEADAAWLAVGPGMIAGFGLAEWLRLTAITGLEFQTSRPVMVIEGLGEVEQIGALELYALLGAEWIF